MSKDDVTLKAMYAATSPEHREVGEAQFRRNCRKGMAPNVACRRRSTRRRSQGGWVYRIRHVATGRDYYGITTTPGETDRWKGHVADARRGRGSGGSLEEAIRGENFRRDAFAVEAVVQAQSADELRELERYYIQTYDTLVPRGMNLDPGGSLGGILNRTPVDAGGQSYETITDACAEHGVARNVYHQRRKLGYSVEQALGIAPRPERTDLPLYVVDDTSYRGSGALARAYELPRDMVVSRLRRGWSPEEAVGRTAPPRKRTRVVACSMNTKALSKTSGVPESTLRHRLFEQGMSLKQASTPGKRNGGHPVSLSHAGECFSYPSIRQAAHARGVKYVTVKRRLRHGATLAQALGVEHLPSRRRCRPVVACPRSRAKPVEFAGLHYPSRSEAARANGCRTPEDVKWFCGLLRCGLDEEEIRRRLKERLRKH